MSDWQIALILVVVFFCGGVMGFVIGMFRGAGVVLEQQTRMQAVMQKGGVRDPQQAARMNDG